MARSKPKFIRNPQTPRTSIMSGRKADPQNGRRMIDLGVDAINRYGFVYIDEHDAILIAELIGWLPPDTTLPYIAELEAQNRDMRARLEAAPLLTTEISERFHDGLNTLTRDLTADYRDRLAGIGLAAAEIPVLGESSLTADVAREDEAGSEPAGDPVEGATRDDDDPVGGPKEPVVGGADGDPGDDVDAAEPASADGGDVPAAGGDAAAGAAGGHDETRAASDPPAGITDIVVEDAGVDGGNKG